MEGLHVVGRCAERKISTEQYLRRPNEFFQRLHCHRICGLRGIVVKRLQCPHSPVRHPFSDVQPEPESFVEKWIRRKSLIDEGHCAAGMREDKAYVRVTRSEERREGKEGR